MVRIKTTTRIIKKEFLSPFVYTENEAKKLIDSLLTWHKTPKYEIVHVKGYPSAARPVDFLISDSDIRKAEFAWRNYNYRNREE